MNPNAQKRSRKDEAILSAVRLVEEALDKREAVNVSDMAEACFLSESHFRRVFSAVMGDPPKNYLMRKKIEKAAELLRQTDEPISEICFHCGFRNHSTFYRDFVKHYGCNPSDYRSERVWEK